MKLLLLALLVAGCGSGGRIEVPGGGTVHLAGDYLVSWRANPTSAAGCGRAPELRRDATTVPLVDETTNPPTHGSTRLHAVAGDYVIDAGSGCDWTFTFAPD